MHESPFFEEWDKTFMAPTDEQDALRQAIEAERELSQELIKYVGLHVAVYNHEVVAFAETLEELDAMVAGREIDGIFFVLPPLTGASFFANAA